MTGKKKIGVFILLLIFFFSFFSSAIDLREEIRERKIPTYIIEGTSYVSLKSLLKILNCEDSWGMVEDRIFIIYDGSEIKFKVNGNQVVFEDKVKELNVPVKEIEGEILLPVGDFGVILSGIERKSVSAEQSVRNSNGIEKIPAKKEEEFVVLIDPGHGGKDAGAVGYFGLKEKDVNLDIALRMGNYLKKELRKFPHVKVYMTRNVDIYLSLEDRVEMAKDINAGIFFSIHANSSRNRRQNANGFETYYSGEKENLMFLPAPSNAEGIEDDVNYDSAIVDILEDLSTTSAVDESRILADFVQERLAERLLTPDRGTKRRNFYVLRYTPMPAILTEVGFLCNPNIELNLRDVEVRQAIGETLGKSLIDYLRFRKIVTG
jgi:N-acetylmuramoyl-L-alanine amidase